jgi:protein-disulfide isomerase
VQRNLLVVLGVAVLIAVGVGAYMWSSGGNTASGLLAAAGGAQEFEIKPTDMVKGSVDAPVTMVEYASMTCPHCAAFNAEIVPQLTAEYINTGKVKFVFREYPLDGAASMASAAARCLSGDAYFAFIDLLFRNQREWLQDFDQNQQMTKEDIEEGLARMGRMAGLSREQILGCANDPEKTAIVHANWQEGQTRYRVEATPTFFINGKMHRAGLTYDELKAVLEAEIPD